MSSGPRFRVRTRRFARPKPGPRRLLEDRGPVERSVNARAFAQSAMDPGLLAVAGDDGVFLSRDRGETWTASGYGLMGFRSSSRLLLRRMKRERFLPAPIGRLSERATPGRPGSGSHREWFSTRRCIRSISSPPRRASLWVSTCGWVYRSVDSGDHWVRLTTGFTNRRSPAMKLDPTARAFSTRVLSADSTDPTTAAAPGIWFARDPRRFSARRGSPTAGSMWDRSERGCSFRTMPALHSSGNRWSRGSANSGRRGRSGRLRARRFLRANGGIESGVWELRDGRADQISRAAPPGGSSWRPDRVSRRRLVCGSASTLVSRDGPDVCRPRPSAAGQNSRFVRRRTARRATRPDGIGCLQLRRWRHIHFCQRDFRRASKRPDRASARWGGRARGRNGDRAVSWNGGGIAKALPGPLRRSVRLQLLRIPFAPISGSIRSGRPDAGARIRRQAPSAASPDCLESCRFPVR